MRSPSPSAFAVKKMSLDDVVYLFRLVEMSLDDIVITESNRITWPKSLKGIKVPPVDGVLALYDVTNQQSIDGIPDLLRWFSHPEIPSLPPLHSLFCQPSTWFMQSPAPAEFPTTPCVMPFHASQHHAANKFLSIDASRGSGLPCVLVSCKCDNPPQIGRASCRERV